MSHGHWPIILAAAVVAWLLGAIWYSPVLFAKAWVRANGYSPEKVAAMRANAAKTYTGSFLALILVAFILHLFLSRLGASTMGAGAGWGFHAWVGFAFPIGFTAYLYSDKPLIAFLIDTGYQLVYLTVMGAMLGNWA